MTDNKAQTARDAPTVSCVVYKGLAAKHAREQEVIGRQEATIKVLASGCSMACLRGSLERRICGAITNVSMPSRDA